MLKVNLIYLNAKALPQKINEQGTAEIMMLLILDCR
jgi:hypothetical protein